MKMRERERERVHWSKSQAREGGDDDDEGWWEKFTWKRVHNSHRTEAIAIS